MVDYYCKSARKWKRTTIVQMLPEGVRLAIRGSVLPQAEVHSRLRIPFDCASASPRIDDTCGSSLGGAGRQRGEYNSAFGLAARQWLNELGSVAGIFRKFTQTFSTSEDRIKLKEKMLFALPKINREGICFLNFQSHPCQKDVSGHVHASSA